MRLGQRDAELDAVAAGEVGASGKQGLVLAVVVAVRVEEALAGGGQDLVGHELLLVEAVAQPLGLARRRQEHGACGHLRVPIAPLRTRLRARLGQRVEQVIAGDDRTLPHEMRIGRDEVRGVRPAIDRE